MQTLQGPFGVVEIVTAPFAPDPMLTLRPALSRPRSVLARLVLTAVTLGACAAWPHGPIATESVAWSADEAQNSSPR